MNESEPKAERKARPRPKYQTHGKRKKREARKATTQDGLLIQGLMSATGVKGSHKDYVVIVGTRMIEWNGAVEVLLLPDAPIDSAPVLIQKRNLSRYIGDAALQYWSPARGRLPPGPRSG